MTLGGQTITGTKQLLGEWAKFLGKKFSRTAEDAERYGEWKPLRPPDTSDEPTDQDLDICLQALRKAKACGSDGVPAEAYKKSSKARALLFELIKKVWREEDIPEAMVEGIFVMLFKNKGSASDYSKYRAICL